MYDSRAYAAKNVLTSVFMIQKINKRTPEEQITTGNKLRPHHKNLDK